MKSKAYVAFLNKVITYERDIEILDALSCKSLTDADIKKTRHPKSANLTMTRQEATRLKSHLKSTLYEGLIKNAYEVMMWYFRDIIDSVLRNGVDPVKVSDTNLKAMTIPEIIKTGSWDALCGDIASRIIRGLENLRDTPKSVQELEKRLSLTIDPKCLDGAKPYFEVRHLLVHNNGSPDEKFRKKYPDLLNNAGEISLNCDNVRAAINAIKAYVKDFDAKIIHKKILADCDCQG
jgi:hypothetical protein